MRLKIKKISFVFLLALIFFIILAILCRRLQRVRTVQGWFLRLFPLGSRVRREEYRIGSEQLETQFPIGLVGNLNFRPPAPETYALPLDQLAVSRYKTKWLTSAISNCFLTT